MLVKPKKSNIYAKPKDLLFEYNKSLELGKPTDKFLLLITKIAKNYIKTERCVNKIDEDACVNFAVSEAWRKWNKFNPEKSDNLFSYFTSIIANDINLHRRELKRHSSLNISIDVLTSNPDK